MRRRNARPTLRESMLASQRGLDHYATLTGKPRVVVQGIPPEPKHRIRRPSDGQPTAPTEKQIQSAILEAIGLRRDLVFVGRFNRGQMVSEYNGRTSYTEFNTVPGFPDIHGLLLGGKAFYIEVKRPPPNYRRPTTEQQAFIDAARNAGAYAGVATSIEEANAILA